MVGGLSPLGLLAAGITAAASASGNRRRRDAAIADAAPRWRYTGTGPARIADGRLTFFDQSGMTRTFDLRALRWLDQPDSGWIRLQPHGSDVAWAIAFMS